MGLPHAIRLMQIHHPAGGSLVHKGSQILNSTFWKGRGLWDLAPGTQCNQAFLLKSDTKRRAGTIPKGEQLQELSQSLPGPARPTQSSNGAWHGGPSGSSSRPLQPPGAPAPARFMRGGQWGPQVEREGMGELGSRTQDKKLGG